MNEKKKWYFSKTIVLAFLQAAVGLLTAFAATVPELQTAGWVVTAKSALDLILRFYTDKPIA